MNQIGAAAAVLALSLAGCGYHVAGKANLMPKNVKTIAVAPWSNITVRYRLTDRLPAAITREFISRSHYRIVADPNQADAVLSGAVILYGAYPIVFDPSSGRASAIQVNVRMQISLTDREGKVLFSRPGVEYHERYEISVNPANYFDESDAALDRLARDVARTVVSAVLESF
jgi:hypothetical protein